MKISLPNTVSQAPRIDEIALCLTPGSTDHEPTTLSCTAWADRVVVLFIFGIDCGTCKHLAGMLSDFRAEFASQVEFVGICLQSGCEERLESFLTESGARLKLAYCSSRQLYPALHISPGTWLFYPTLIFIDQRQRMRGYFAGGDNFFRDTAANLREILHELLSEAKEGEALRTDEKVEARV